MHDEYGLDEFCDALWLEDGLARNTLDAYRGDLVQFAQWLAQQTSKGLPDTQAGPTRAKIAL